MIPHIGYGELLLILASAFLLFGAKRVPEIARALGRSIRDFKTGLRENTDNKAAHSQADGEK